MRIVTYRDFRRNRFAKRVAERVALRVYRPKVDLSAADLARMRRIYELHLEPPL